MTKFMKNAAVSRSSFFHRIM